MKRYFRWLYYKLLFVVLTTTAAAIFLLTTTPGLYSVMQLVSWLTPITIKGVQIKGTLLSHITFEQLTYDDATRRCRITQGNIDWSLKALLGKKLEITRIQADTIAFLQKRQPKTTLTTHKALPISIQLKQLQVASFWLQDSVLEQPIQQLQLRADLDQEKLQIHQLAGQWQKTQFALHGSYEMNAPHKISAQLQITDAQMAQTILKKMPMNAHITIPLKKTLPDTTLQLSITGQQTKYYWQGAIKGALTGTLHGTLSDLNQLTALVQVTQPAPLTWRIQATRNQQRIITNTTLQTQHGQLTGTATYRTHGQPKLSATASLNMMATPIIPGLDSWLVIPGGQVILTMQANGTLQNPNIQGSILLKQGQILLPKLNIALSPVQASFTSKHQHWHLNGQLGAEGKTLFITGQGKLTPLPSGELQMTAENFPAMRTAEYRIDLSPQLLLKVQPSGLSLSGTVLVPVADLKPITFSSTTNLTEDAVFVSDKKATTPPLPITTHVTIRMGSAVALNIKGLHGTLEGSIQIKKNPPADAYAIGELSIRNGKYKAYGQDLFIEQGQLIFTGGVMNNPGIRLRAVRYFNQSKGLRTDANQLFNFSPDNLNSMDFGNKMTVGIEVSGRINSTKIKLFSVPATLSQADILSMIILGRPANQASKSGGQLLMAAISSMNLDSGTKGMQLIEQLKQSLGVDVNLQSSSQYNQASQQVTDDTTVVIGKALSKRLYLSYNVGVFQQDSNLLTLKYLLNQFFSIQVTTSDTGNGIDLLYTRQK